MPDDPLLVHRETLLSIAHEAVAYGVRQGEAPKLKVENFAPVLREPRATFVTLELAGELRGCIGCLDAHQPLAADVNQNAYAAAFADPRFPPVHANEVPRLSIHISVLSPPELLNVASEAELLATLQVGVDGVILEERGRRSTFLPSVWEQLPDARRFLRQLKRKGGWREDYWSDAMVVKRYRCLTLHD